MVEKGAQVVVVEEGKVVGVELSDEGEGASRGD
jgi:hypothetical protein